MFSVELLKAFSKAIFVPATNDHLATWAGAEEHLLEAFISDEVR